jgi:hypothetical protein
VRDALPAADVAVSVCMVHHLRDEELVQMIRNVGRTCRRFVILDLVRHRVPLALFSVFGPLCLPRVNVLDGRQSIRRAYWSTCGCTSSPMSSPGRKHITTSCSCRPVNSTCRKYVLSSVCFSIAPTYATMCFLTSCLIRRHAETASHLLQIPHALLGTFACSTAANRLM